MGINNGLKVGDLLSLKVKDVRSLREGDCIAIKESKTGKTNILMVNRSVYKALKNYFENLNPDDNAFLFASRKSKGSLNIQAVNSLVKKWTKAINLNQKNYGAHTYGRPLATSSEQNLGLGLRFWLNGFVISAQQ